MTYDERERRDWPSEEGEEGDAGETSSADEQPAAAWGTLPPSGDEEPSEEGEEAARPAEAAEPQAGEPWSSRDAAQGWEPAPERAAEPSWPPPSESEQPATGATEPSDLELETQPPSEEGWRSDPASPSWPTEPPLAGSVAPSTWPTAPPERDVQETSTWPTSAPEHHEPGEAPMAEAPESAAHEPPPSEVEAYGVSPAVPAAAAAAAHSVPATAAEVAESTQCPRCGTENPAGLAFCRNCGQRLVAAGVAPAVERPGAPEGTMACPRCGTHNRVGVAFCQNCGANLRTAAMGYVPPAVEPVARPAAAAPTRVRAVLGPVVLLVGVIGLVTAYLLPFAYGTGSLYERAVGVGGYGIAFWTAYADVGGGLADQAYYGFAAPTPILMALLLLLAIGGLVRAAPGPIQIIGLVISLVWSVGLAILFAVVEVAGNWQGDLVGLLRVLTPAGIIFFMAALIVLIGTMTRFGRS